MVLIAVDSVIWTICNSGLLYYQCVLLTTLSLFKNHLPNKTCLHPYLRNLHLLYLNRRHPLFSLNLLSNTRLLNNISLLLSNTNHPHSSISPLRSSLLQVITANLTDTQHNKPPAVLALPQMASLELIHPLHSHHSSRLQDCKLNVRFILRNNI